MKFDHDAHQALVARTEQKTQRIRPRSVRRKARRSTWPFWLALVAVFFSCAALSMALHPALGT